MNNINLNEYKDKATIEYNKYNKLINTLANLRLIAFILMIIMFITGYYNTNIYTYIGWLLLIIFIILIIIHNKYYKLYTYYKNYLKIINEYLDRLNNNWHNFKNTGEEYLNNTNIYLEDLDIIGKNSLYQYLCCAKTKGGKDKLYQRFITVNKDTSEILELSKNIDFCIDYQISLLKFDNKSINLEDNNKYLETPISNKTQELIISLIISTITIILLILSIFNIISYKYFFSLFIINYLASYIYQIIYREEFDILTKCIDNFSKLKSIYQVILKYKFKDKNLINKQNNIRKSMISLNKLNQLEMLNNLKDNLIASFIFNGLIYINVITLYLFSKFKTDKDLKLGITVTEELESLVSLSILPVVKKNICIAKYSKDTILEFDNLYHPLLKENNCIPNSFKSTNGINIITGSNMGGKSTFLRTIGINLILMNATGIVNANNFTSNNYKIFTSMRIKDDSLNGISTFYGELLRIKEAIDYSSKNKPMVVLVDEIFKGTNYNDRLYGAKEVMQKLNKDNIILFITTHDFELCDFKISNINNYHFKEHYEKGKIKFNYKINKGKCDSTNARYLMESLGIINIK